MSHWGEAEAAAFLTAQGFGPGPFGIARLAGGLWNDVLRIEVAATPLVLKHYAEVLPGTLFPNLPEAEAAALQRLAGLDVAPDFRGFWPGAGVLLYSFVPGNRWQDDVAAVARMLRRKEAADPAGFRLLPLSPEAILAEADTLFARCTATGLVRLWLDRRPVPLPVAPPRQLRLVHTDIGAGNLIGSRDGLRLIDWQCPGAGDTAEDVFSFLSPAFQIVNDRPPLNHSQRAAFFRALALPDTEARHALLEPFYAFRMAGYCCLRMQTAPDPAVREMYSRAVRAELDQSQSAT